jgi:hypothetical protein
VLVSRPLKPGDAVLLIGGPRRGEVTTVVDVRKFYNKRGCSFDGEIVNGEMSYFLASVSRRPGCKLAARREWLLPLHDPDKAAEYLAELNVPEREGQR